MVALRLGTYFFLRISVGKISGQSGALLFYVSKLQNLVHFYELFFVVNHAHGDSFIFHSSSAKIFSMCASARLDRLIAHPIFHDYRITAR